MFNRYVDVKFPANCIKIFEIQAEHKSKWIPGVSIPKRKDDPSPTGKFGV